MPSSPVRPVPFELSRIMVYLPRSIKDEFEKFSEKQRRSMSQMAVFLIEEAIENDEKKKSKSN